MSRNCSLARKLMKSHSITSVRLLGVTEMAKSMRPTKTLLARVIAAVITTAILILTPNAVHATQSELDPSFGTAGIVSGIRYSNGSSTDEHTYIRSTAVQADGKIVVAGNSVGDLRRSSAFIARYNVDGSIDTTFANQGWALFDFGVQTFEGVLFTSVSVQADGGIIASGRSCVPGNCLLQRVSLVRLLSNGQPDSSFAQQGTAILPFNGYLTGEATAQEVLADGTVYLVGTCNATFQQGVPSVLVAKLSPMGTLDASFGSDGQVCVNPTNPAFYDYVYYSGIAVLPDGNILISGEMSGSNTTLVTSLTPTGTFTSSPPFPDTTMYFPGSSVAQSTAAAFVNGKFTVAGFASNGSGFFGTLAQFNTSRTLDLAFGGAQSGIVEFRQQLTATRFRTLAAACSGDLYAAGDYVANQLTNQGVIAAYTSAGDPLTSFNPAGSTTLAVPGSMTVEDVALDSGARLVVVGSAFVPSPDLNQFPNTNESFIAVYETPNQGCPTPPNPIDPSLAPTGATTSPLLVSAIAVLAAGLGLWMLLTRRTKETIDRK